MNYYFSLVNFISFSWIFFFLVHILEISKYEWFVWSILVVWFLPTHFGLSFGLELAVNYRHLILLRLARVIFWNKLQLLVRLKDTNHSAVLVLIRSCTADSNSADDIALLVFDDDATWEWRHLVAWYRNHGVHLTEFGWILRLSVFITELSARHFCYDACVCLGRGKLWNTNNWTTVHSFLDNHGATSINNCDCKWAKSVTIAALDSVVNDLVRIEEAQSGDIPLLLRQIWLIVILAKVSRRHIRFNLCLICSPNSLFDLLI